MNKFRKASFTVIFFAITCAASYASADMQRLEKYFLEARYEKAVSEAESLIDARSRQRDEVYYLKGLSELKLKRFGDARGSFRDILDKYPGSERTFDAYVGAGDSYLLENRAASALKEYESAVARFPKNSNIVTVYSRMSECRSKLGEKVKEDERVEKGYISVQVGSFKNKKNAEKIARKLSSEGFESYLDLPSASGDSLYRVRVGRLNSNQTAESLASRLRARGYSTKICSDNVCR